MMATDPKKYADLRKKVEFQVACEEKAFRIVERLIENPISPEYLHDALHFITPSHYNDIVEERAVSKLCGYPLCPKSLDKVLKQKYMISTKTNKVYDIEERKNFCSARCYQASQHIQKQISSSPVWTRNIQPPKKISFLSLDTHKGKVGEEVFLSMADELREEIKAIDKMDKYQDKLEERKAKINDHDDRLSHAEDDKSEVYTLDRALKEMDLDRTDDKSNTGNVHRDTCQNTGVTGNNVNLEDRVLTKENNETDNIKLSDNIHEHDTKFTNKVSVTDSKDSNKSKHSKVKSKGSNPQTEYLMKLLDKRKALLSKMAEIQEPSVTSLEKSHEGNKEETVDKQTVIKRNTEDSNKEIPSTVNSSKISDVSETHTHSTQDQTLINLVKEVSLPSYESESGQIQNTKQTILSKPSAMKQECVNKSGISLSSPVESILEVIQSWITKDSLNYLSVERVTEGSRDEFQRQYQELVRKVDAQEKDFDQLLGEECMEKQEVSCKAPVPDFELIRKEAEENYQKVYAFLGGKLTYKVKEKIVEKDTNSSPQEIVLPTVDRYNQMLIRQKIVLDRISKVLPELLSPLRLFVQDVFTELRELVSTFNLTSENILFKPGEWLIVTLILLKLLCRRLLKLQHAFTTSGANSHFKVLLDALKFDTENLEKRLNSLLSLYT